MSSLHHFCRQSIMPVDLTTLFAWHERPGALERLIPPWDPLQVVKKDNHIKKGARVTLRMQVGPIPLAWQALHTDYEPLAFFRDEQQRGPFRSFIHTHRFLPGPHQHAILQDTIEYQLPLGPLGNLLQPFIQRQLSRTFHYRHHILHQDLLAHGTGRQKPLTFLISGAAGVVGRSLVPFLTSGGHRVIRLVRRQASGPDEIFWDPEQGILELDQLEKLDVVIHLAGENIAGHRWTMAKKKRIIESRTKGTGLLARRIAARRQKPQAFLSASAIGFYGDRQDQIVTEADPMGNDFISHVCAEWEAATRPVAQVGIRLVQMRIGIALTPKGGALKTILGPARLGLIGPLGSGSQYMSWLSINDLIWAIHHVAMTETLHGPVNICGPEPLTNSDFCRILAAKIGRVCLPAIPAWLLRLRFGEMANEIPLASTRVQPRKLLASGFCFRSPCLDTALDYLLGTME